MQVRERHKIVALSGDVALEFCLARSLLASRTSQYPEMLWLSCVFPLPSLLACPVCRMSGINVQIKVWGCLKLRTRPMRYAD